VKLNERLGLFRQEALWHHFLHSWQHGITGAGNGKEERAHPSTFVREEDAHR